MKRNMMNFAAKTIAFALFFIVFLFADSLSAADGCQASGCDTSADGQYNATAFSKPTYAPSWTEVTKSMGPVRGGQYLKFSVVEGEIYTWSTEGKEDVFGGNYSATCSSDEISDNCRTASDTELRGLRCFGGYCTLPFDTELTLLKGEVCTATAQPIAYSNSGGFRNQSSLEWKADFTGPVVLLVTNNKYQGGVTSASSGSYIPCQKTSQKEVGPSGAEMEMTTTVKWQRSASEPCSTCGEKTKYRTDKTALSPEQAPKWRTVQSRQAVNLLDFLPTPITPENLTGNYPNDKWLKPGSYVVFNVIENQIYRWSTCIADFQDTQLTLFKGDQGGTGDDGKACGQVLAYGDDSKVSYTSAKRIDDEGHEIDDEDPAHFATFCPAGTKQTVLEWKANFTGKVTLLLNEYNCYQCYPQEVALSGGITYNNWLNCFYEVTGSFQTDGGEFVFENGWPVEVASGDPSSMPGSFIYPFPLDWQRYDCDTCEGAPVKTIDDFSETPGTNAFTDGGSQVVYAGQPLLFNLKRGSKYLFEAADENTIITIKRGNSCDGDLVDQASGKLTYFAEAEGDYDSEGHYIDEPDVITVFISPQDCREDDDFSDTLTYSYYTSAGNSKTRFLEAQYTGSDNVVTDSSTTLQFVDTGEWAHTWQEAINTCQNKTVGNSGSGNTIPCVDPVCPAGNYTFQNGYFCKYNSTGADASGNCKSPVCATNYSEFQKTSANANDPELQDLFGLCYYSGTQCDVEEWVTVGTPSYYIRPALGCNDGDEYIAVKGKCGHCDTGILGNIGTPVKPNWVCSDTQCKSSQQCITIGGFCSSIGAEQSSCPEGYIYLSSKNKCFDPDGAVPVYGTPTDSGEAMRWPNTGISYTSTASGCPSGMHELGDGTCEYDTCGEYAYLSDFTNTTVLKKLLDEDPVACYLTPSTSGTKVPCCCSKPIQKFKANGSISGTYYPLTYATSLGGFGTVSTTGEWKCQLPDQCPGGQYVASINQCVKCATQGDVLYQRNENLFGCRTDCGENYIITTDDPPEQKCVSCLGVDETLFVANNHSSAKCVACGEGRTAVADGSGGYLCILDEDQCNDDSHVVVELTEGMSCAPAVASELKCKEGWIKDPAAGTKCRKLQSTGTGVNYTRVKCTSSECSSNPAACLAPNLDDRTCDPDKPNSYDCHCYVDRCEDAAQEQDKKICPDCKYVCSNGGDPTLNPINGKYYCGAFEATCLHTTPIETTTILKNGTTVIVYTECKFTDASGQTCGEAMGGWTLPNINQLYSIVDFDLYDPATAYPFQEGYVRLDLDDECTPIPHPAEPEDCAADADCNTAETGLKCIGGKCLSSDPYGDLQCGEDGNYICMDNQCVRNNWFWSSTTVISEGANNGKFIWAVNMEDGRSYQAVKGCTGADCLSQIDLNARPHHVLCVKGSTFAGIFDNDAPTYDQTFSGWACDKDYPQIALNIYFEIRDSKGKDMVLLLGSEVNPDYADVIPGLGSRGIKYGPSDDSMITEAKKNEIYNNCGFANAGNNHAFGVMWRTGSVTDGKEGIAGVLAQIYEKECSDARLADADDTKDNCGVPPYFVTAYGVNDTSTSGSTAIAISPTERPFVFKNRCGDGYKTNDGTYTESCESENLNEVCPYGDGPCQICAKENMTVDGTEVKACTYYNGTRPHCNDGTLQSYYCVDGVISAGHPGAGLDCEFYDFMTHNNTVAFSEECDCSDGGYTFYYYADPENFVCDASYGLTQSVCPEYNTVSIDDYDPNDQDGYCYICAGCKRTKTAKPRCGDKTIHRPNCTGYTNCEVVQGANEECDDGNNSNTDSCTNECKLGACGDGFIQYDLGEICDSGAKNGWYATNCVGTESCPGCAGWKCGKDDTEELGPRCGDGKIQNRDMCTNAAKVEAAGYADFDAFYADNHFANAADCQQKLTGASEVCDLGKDDDGNSLNGLPVAFEAFRQTTEGAECAAQIDNAGEWYPVNAIHAKYLECVYKYKQFLETHSGCAANCESKTAPYCGDGKIGDGEVCDNGLPEVHYDEASGKYVLDSAYEGQNFNGAGYRSDSCRLDCKGSYNCNDDIVETSNCAGVTAEGFCPKIVDDDGTLFVKGAKEICDDGDPVKGGHNGVYGYCAKGCQKLAFCGSGGGNDITKLDCIEGEGADCKREECDFGMTGDDPNRPVDAAYSKEKGGSCIAEDKDVCAGAEWGDMICCKHGRYCGDGTVDSGLKVGNGLNWTGRKTIETGSGGTEISYAPSEFWTLNGVTVTYDPHNMSLRFEMTSDLATAELSADIPIDLNLRYFLEYNFKIFKISTESADLVGGVNEYDESGNLLTSNTYTNASPYIFTDVTDTLNDWYRAKNTRPIKGEGSGDSWKWFSGTKKVRIYLNMTGTAGTQFLVRALAFYDMENVIYSSSADEKEMCDPGEGHFKTDSTSYMTDCNSDCQWINYCGDGKVQRSGSCNDDGTYNGYQCASGIQYAAEVCDNGSNSANIYNGCEPGCLELGPHCGDGYTDKKSCPTDSETWCHTPSGTFTEEKCDDGGLNNNDALCTKEEPCQVSSIKDYGACRKDCRPARCGDGIPDYVVDASGKLLEECDCGVNASSYFEGVTDQQTTEVNGETYFLCLKNDGTPLYNTITAQRPALCRPNCKISRCGDGILDQVKDTNGNVISGEECDDGNFSDYDSCTNECKFNLTGDGILAHSRSYLCEELLGENVEGVWKGISEAQMKIMRNNGVVDCVDSGSTLTCATLASDLNDLDGTDGEANLKEYFESGVLHCCYNQKFNGGTDDKNCQYEYDGIKWTPKDWAIKQCTTYAENVSANGSTMNGYKSHDDCVALEAQGGMYAAWEQCEHCIDATCGKSCESGDEECLNRRQRNCETKCEGQTNFGDCVEECIVRNTYCNDKGWNIIGSCGDGQVNADAGEVCDNNIAAEDRYYTDIYGLKVAFSNNWHYKDGTGKWYDGHYCTGPCRGNCDTTKRICEGASDNNCWTEGCTISLHRSSNEPSETSSTCGDGFYDYYAGEECDYDVNHNSDNWEVSYCSTTCKKNRQDGGATTPVAKCGDNQIQSQNEACDDGNEADDDYCIGDGTTDKNGYVNHCKISFGSCGDGKIKGHIIATSTVNALTLYDSLISEATMTAAGHSKEGPEDCDTEDERTKSLVNAGLDVDTLCGTINSKPCQRIGYCGDTYTNPRFESCDFGEGNATQNITNAEGKTCYAGCKSDPKGGIIKATNSEISGWACDPDHPMVHPDPDTLPIVIIRITDANGATVGEKNLKTTKDVAGKDYFGNIVDSNFTAKACGGGKLHGWTYNPSEADDAMLWTGKQAPYTVKAYAKTLDGEPETAEVFIGEKEFVKAMSCGDSFISTCGEIEVTKIVKTPWDEGMVCNDEEVDGVCSDYGLVNGEACADSEGFTCSDVEVNKLATGFWDTTTTCIDDIVAGTCADYGLTAGQKCVDEECDDGENNSNNKDCDATCKLTRCGDGKVQAQSTRKEECEVTINGATITMPADATCGSLSDLEPDGELDIIFGSAACDVSTTGESNKTCRWTRTSCEIESKCPPLSTAITSAWGSNYKPALATLYVRRNTSGAETYFRSWKNSTEKWGDREMVSVYKGNAASGSNAETCSFECQPDFVWDGTCKPRTGLKLDCPACSDDNGVWTGTTNSCKTNNPKKQLDQTLTVNSDGTLTYDPASATIQYSTTVDAKKCNWECSSDSRYNGSKCMVAAKKFECTGKPANTKWLPVTFSKSGSTVTYTVGTPADSLLIDQTISGSGTTWAYVPSDANLAAVDINDGTKSPNQLISTGTALAEINVNGDGLLRCYYTCADGYVYNAAATGDDKCEKARCGDGKVSHDTCLGISGTCYITQGADEKCDDAGYNGTHKDGSASAAATSSHCDKFCGSYKTCMSYYCGANDDGSYKTCDLGTASCKFIQASGYNGKTGRVTNSTTQATDGKFYCGDGKIQYKSGACTSGDCDLINLANYPGANIDTYGNIEQCDPNGSHNDIQTLCATIAGPGHDYSQASGVSCNTECKIIGTDGCNYCGDGTVNGSEQCENTSDGKIKFSDNTTFDKSFTGKTFSSSNTSYSIPVSGRYKITVYGGQGGNGDGGFAACRGAKVWGTFTFTKGETLNILVGSKGVDGYRDDDYYFGGGGGGASGVRKNDSTNTLLLIAGGGGGGGYYNDQKLCTPGQASTSGSSPDGANTAASGGNNGSNGNSSGGGKGYNNGWSMGGGNGAARYTTDQWGDVDHRYSFGGGGGGYSGGDGASNDDYGGGGGGSYKSGDDSGWLSGGDESQTHTGAGEVVIELLEYRPCSTDTCKIDTSSYVSVGISKVACTGLPANAEWWPNKSGLTPPEVTQSKEDGVWDPSNAGSYSATDPGSTANVCKYHCATNFTWDGSACTNVKTNVSCGPLPTDPAAEAYVKNTVDEITQNWNGSAWVPEASWQHNDTPSATECHYKCTPNYTWDGGKCRNQRPATCEGLPAHARWTSNNSTSKTITQFWSPTEPWHSTTTGSYNPNDTAANECYFKCRKNYTWNSSTKKCVADERDEGKTCEAKPANSVWNDGKTGGKVGKFHQVWNEDDSTCDETAWNANNCWYPRTKDPVYKPTTSAECGYKCSATFHTENGGTTCISDERTKACPTLPTGALANTATSIHQDWDPTLGSDCTESPAKAEKCWIPKNTLEHSSDESVGSTTLCRYKCNVAGNFEWSSSAGACIGSSTTETCTDLPAHATWWAKPEHHGTPDSQTITQTWTNVNGTWKWWPVKEGAYSATNPSKPNECHFHCNTNYHYDNGQCVADTRLTVDCAPNKPTKADWNDNGQNGKILQTWNELASADCSATQWTNNDCWFPRSKNSNHSATAGECIYQCNYNYNWNNSQSSPSCDPQHQSGTCSTKPANTVWNDGDGYSGSGTFEQIWNGSIFNPATFTSVYSPTTATVCGYKCADGYHSENGGKTCCAQGYHTEGSGTTCIADERTTASCDAKDANAIWNDGGKNGKFHQTWDYSTSSWTPASHTSTRSTTAGECVYKCPDDATNGHFVDDPNDAKKCIGKTTTGNNCTAKPTHNSYWWNTSTNGKISQTWTNVSGTWQWSPTTTSSHTSTDMSSTNGCYYKCGDSNNYGMNGSDCGYCKDGTVNGPETCEAGTRQRCNAGCSGCGCSDKYKWRECKSDCSGWESWSDASTSYNSDTYGTNIGGC